MTIYFLNKQITMEQNSQNIDETVAQPTSEATSTTQQTSKKGKFPTWYDLLAVLGIFLIVQLVARIVVSLLGCEIIPNDQIATAATAVKRTMEFEMGRTTFFYALLSQPLVLLLVILYRQFRGGEWRIVNYSVRGFNPTILLWGFVMLLAIAVVVEPVMQLLPEVAAPTGRGVYMLLALLVIAPIFEELLCRGVILEAIRRKHGGFIACVLSSLIFGVMHLEPQAVLNAFMIGMLLGYLYIRTNSIFAPMLIHLFNNVIAYLFLVFGLSGTTLHSLIKSDTIYNMIYAVSVGVVILSIIAISQQIIYLDKKKAAAKLERK